VKITPPTTTTTTRPASATACDDHRAGRCRRINENGGQFAGQDRYEARRQIVEALQARGDIDSIKPHEMLIGRCQRSDDVVEPRLKTQWFVRVRRSQPPL